MSTLWHENKHGEPLFLLRFYICLSCNINIPSFIGNLWWVLLLGNHLNSYCKFHFCPLSSSVPFHHMESTARNFTSPAPSVSRCQPCLFPRPVTHSSFALSPLSYAMFFCAFLSWVFLPVLRLFLPISSCKLPSTKQFNFYCVFVFQTRFRPCHRLSVDRQVVMCGPCS